MGRTDRQRPAGRTGAKFAGRESPVSRAWLIWTSLALAAVSLTLYLPVGRHPFVGFDDLQYVADNPHVRSGLTWDGLRWAFTSGEQGNWHPLTWLSHMLDVELFGLDAGAHHLTNVALHIANSVLLLVALVWFTGARWRSAMVAALFAVHPLHVESVAWVAERKDVLSACFWTAALIAYGAYARRRDAARYLAVLALFAAGLMSKPMVVTFPFVLLLLDLWPLSRVASLNPTAWRPLLLEKLPFVVLTAASSVVTFLVQQQSGAVQALETLSIGRRLGTALLGYQTYLVRLVWPRGLAVLYPFPESLPLWKPAAAALVLTTLTVLAVRAWRERPWIAVGWLWFLGTLVPVIGIVQIGSQPVADRYTYIPYTGLFIALAWIAGEIVERRPGLRRLAIGAVLAALGAFGFLARQQVHYWRDGVTLWTRALAVTERNYRAHSALGFALERQGRDAEAAAQYTAALAIRPTYVEALNNLGGIRSDQGDLAAASALLSAAVTLKPDHVEATANLAVLRAREGRLDDAIVLFERARALEPDSARIRNGLGFALSRAGRLEEAQTELVEAVRLAPKDVEIQANLGSVLADLGQPDAAVRVFGQALSIQSDHARSHYGLGSALDDIGRREEAAVELATAVRFDPALAEAHNRLGRVLMALGRRDESIAAFDAAVRARPDDPGLRYDLAAMLLKADRRAEAVQQFEEVLRLDADHAGARDALRVLGRIR